LCAFFFKILSDGKEIKSDIGVSPNGTLIDRPTREMQKLYENGKHIAQK
jgi:hypothetical protein